MSETNEATRIMDALGAIEGVARVTRGWPHQPAQDALPCIVVQKTGEKAVGWRDDLEYLTWREYTVRVFAAQAMQADALDAAVRRTMRALGYGRSFSWEESDGTAHQRLSRYQSCM